MKRIICASLSLLMLLTGCTAPAPDPRPTESFTYGIYEFAFAVEQLSGEPTDTWDFVYTYNGETITNCSNTKLKDGRPLPSAFVYGAK